MLVNETLLKQLEWQDPIGKRIFMTDVEGEEFIQVPYQIIGIVRDFHFESLHRPLEPLLLKMPRDIGCLSVKIATTDVPELLNSIEAIWKKMEPARPFDYFFLDDTFDKLYRSEQKLAGFIRSGVLYRRTTNQGNWNSQSSGRFGVFVIPDDVKGLYEMGDSSQPGCLAAGLLGHEKLAGQFRLSY
jgi:hypothetical protein